MAERKEFIIERSISAEVGKGSVAHNGRIFHAKNTDPTRSYLNRCYCNENIKSIYRELFGEALKCYNAKQTRADRRIENYYEKIRSGKQEKPFHELILQIGNCNDTNAQSEVGAVAAEALDAYMKSFQERNPHLRVFAAFLHMDEATPHLHIDFIPFTTGSKRGLETRVSLKSALAQQGITGGSKQETEWNLFVRREKEALAEIMQEHGIAWKQLGTHEKHLSVLDYEKKMRAQEVAELTAQVEQLQENKAELHQEISIAEEQKSAVVQELENLKNTVQEVETEIYSYYTAPEWQTPEPKGLMGAKTYKERLVDPFVKKLKDILTAVVSKFKDLMRKYERVSKELQRERDYSKQLARRNQALQRDSDDLQTLRDELGSDEVDCIITQAEQREEVQEFFDQDWQLRQ